MRHNETAAVTQTSAGSWEGNAPPLSGTAICLRTILFHILFFCSRVRRRVACWLRNLEIFESHLDAKEWRNASTKTAASRVMEPAATGAPDDQHRVQAA